MGVEDSIKVTDNFELPLFITKRVDAYRLIDAERDRQDAKWGEQRDLPRLLWLAILGEEFGEVCKASLECVATFGDTGFRDREQIVYGEKELLEELIQVAAVATCWIEDLLQEHHNLRSIEDLDQSYTSESS